MLGVDISEGMIQHSQTHHPHPTLSYQQLDVRDADQFIADNMSSFSMLTSFSCLHWVTDLPAALKVFNKVLSIGGRFLFVVG